MTRRRIILAALLVLIAGFLAIHAFYRTDLDRAEASARAGAQIASLIAGPVEYAERGVGPAVLSIHGAGGGFDQGFANIDGLIGDGFRIVAPSRFGYLGTPVPADRSYAAQADAHAALLDHLGIDRAIVVGVSAGARSAVELAIRHPEKVQALILIVPGLYAPDSPLHIEASRGSALAFQVVNAGGDFLWWAASKIAPSVLIRFLGVPPGLVREASPIEQVRVGAIVDSVEPLSRRFAGINIDSQPEDRRPAYDRIATPTLIVSADDDLFNTLPAAQYAAAQIKGARLVTFQTGGHLLVGRQDEVRTAVANFLSAAGLTPIQTALR